MGVNAKGVFLGTKVAILVMLAGGSGSIVNIFFDCGHWSIDDPGARLCGQ